MITAHRKMKHTMNLPMVVAFSLCTGLLITLLLALLGGYLIWNETMPQGMEDIWAGGTRFFAILVVCIVAMVAAKERKAIVSCVADVVYTLFLACVNILVLDGRFENILYGVLISALAWVTSVIIYKLTMERTGKRRKFKIR